MFGQFSLCEKEKAKEESERGKKRTTTIPNLGKKQRVRSLSSASSYSFFSFVASVAGGMIDQLEKQKLEQIGCFVWACINTNEILLTFYVASCLG